MYKEHVEAVACPQCENILWKRHNIVSCSTVPFEAECSNCGFLADTILNHDLCPHNEFSYRLPNKEIVRHLKCYICGNQETKFDMEMVDLNIEGKDIVEFGQIGMIISKWRLPNPWTNGKVYMDIGDNMDVPVQVIFCSEKCRNNCSDIIDEESYYMEYKGD